MGEFRMPSLGADMEAGTLVEWKVNEGDRVAEGDVVAVVETAKGAIDVEVFESGVVEAIRVAPGAKVPVGTVLAVIRGEGGAAEVTSPVTPAPAPRREAPAAEPPPTAPAEPLPVAPPAVAPRPAHARATPSARKWARTLGVDLEAVVPSGPGGAIVRADVERAAAAPAEVPRAVAPPVPRAPPSESVPRSPAPAPPSEGERRVALRRTIAAAMSRSKREIPHYYLSTRIDLRRAMRWLDDHNAERPIAERILPVALLLKATARAALEVPEVNGTFEDGRFHHADRVHLGVVVSLRGGGIVAPALHDVDRAALPELMQALTDLVSRARAGHLKSSEMRDATLTVTSLGDGGAVAVFGVIYPPQVAIVGFGGIASEPWALEDGVVSRPTVTATLAADHRVSDGLRGSVFLETLASLLERPEAL